MPTGSNLAMLIVGLVALVVGALQTFSAPFARRMLTMGLAGLIWKPLLGEERAVKLTRYVFGPGMMLFGLFCMLGALIVSHAPPNMR